MRGLSAVEPFVDVSSATEPLFFLERAASALKKSASRPARTWGDESRPQLSMPLMAPRPRALYRAEDIGGALSAIARSPRPFPAMNGFP
jgi:hypothetical protein